MFNPVQMQFNQFMQQMKGKDPNVLIQKLVSSGRISQSQLNEVYRQLQANEKQFESMKKMFGF